MGRSEAGSIQPPRLGLRENVGVTAGKLLRAASLPHRKTETLPRQPNHPLTRSLCIDVSFVQDFPFVVVARPYNGVVGEWSLAPAL